MIDPWIWVAVLSVTLAVMIFIAAVQLTRATYFARRAEELEAALTTQSEQIVDLCDILQERDNALLSYEMRTKLGARVVNTVGPKALN